jgi:hypothetical protein
MRKLFVISAALLLLPAISQGLTFSDADIVIP